MGILIPTRQRVRNKRFDYEPRFYNPDKDRRLKERMRIKSRARRQGGPKGAIAIGLLLILALYLYMKLGAV